MAYQGEYDGLCGMYAIANAFMECGIEDGEEIFKTACSALARNRWPQVLWEGTTFMDMQRMIHACRRKHGIRSIKPEFPFWENEPTSNRDYWKNQTNYSIKMPQYAGSFVLNFRLRLFCIGSWPRMTATVSCL